LEELELWEVSLVTFPMLPSARVAAKSEDTLASEDESLRGIATAFEGLSAELARTSTA
jgi:phage head maturation protease